MAVLVGVGGAADKPLAAVEGAEADAAGAGFWRAGALAGVVLLAEGTGLGGLRAIEAQRLLRGLVGRAALQLGVRDGRGEDLVVGVGLG